MLLCFGEYRGVLGNSFKLNEDYLVLPGSLGVIGVVWFYWRLEFISIFIDELF